MTSTWQWSVDRPGWVPVSRALVYKTSWADGRALYSTTRVLFVNHKSANLIIDLQLLTGIQVLYGRPQNILPWSQLRSFILPLSRLFARPRSKNCLILIFVLIDGMRLIFFPLARAVWRSDSDLSISSSLDPPPSFLFLQSSFVIFLISSSHLSGQLFCLFWRVETVNKYIISKLIIFRTL
jgi:hypothetical protein